MGRPLAKDVLGTIAIGDFTGAATGIRVEIYDTALRTNGVIIKQRGAKTFKCTRFSTIDDGNNYVSTGYSEDNYVGFSDQLLDSNENYVLKNSTPTAIGEMRLFGYVGTNSGNEVNIAKITKRVATDFSANRYNWVLENDSSNDYIVLTPIA